MKRVPLRVLLVLAAVLLVLTAGLIHLVFHTYLFSPGEDRVEGLQLRQEGFTLEVSWEEAECAGYSVLVFHGTENPAGAEVDTNHYSVEGVEIGSSYRVIVSCLDEDGAAFGGAEASIETKKLEQEIRTSREELPGVAGDAIRLETEAQGEITFSPEDGSIAAAEADGTIRFLKAGRTVLHIDASGDERYEAAEKDVEIIVYPETLEAPGLSIGSEDQTTVTLSWSRVEYATGYQLLKRDPVTKKYRKYRETAADETALELVRDHAKYKVRAIADAGERTVKGEKSEALEVIPSGEEAGSYASAHDLMTLDRSDLEEVAMIQRDGDIDVPQSMSFNGSEYIITYVNHAGTKGVLQAWSRDGELTRAESIRGMGHANGSTYDPNTGLIYTVKTHKGTKSRTCTTFHEEDFTAAGDFQLPRNTSGIAYDETNDKFYLSKGNEIYVCSSDFKVEKFIHKKARYNHAQDIGGHNGIVLVCTWVSGSKSYIDLYRVSDKAYLGSYNVPLGEIESCLVDDGRLVILMNTVGSSRDYLYRTKERIAIP